MREELNLNQFINKYKNLNAFSKKAVEGFLTGLHKSPFHGFSVEFAEHRQYNLGEDIKHMDWKLFSRTDKLFVKKYEDETNLRCHIIIDKSTSMFVPKGQYSKYQFCVVAAAAILQILKKQRDAFGITLYSDKIEFATQVKSSPAHFSDCINVLQNELYCPVPEKQTTNSGHVLSQLAEKMSRRSLVVIFTDLNENMANSADFIKGLQHLQYKKHDILLFNVFNKNLELDLEYEDVPTRFLDVETGASVKLNPGEVRAAYQKQIAEFRKTLLEKCTQYKIENYLADINQDLEPTIGAFLRKRAGKN